MPWLELRFPPLLVGLGFGGAMLGVARWVPALAFALPWSSALALALVSIGATTALAGVLAFRRQRTTVDPLRPSAASTLVSAGVYRVSRNPMYLGFLLLLAGWAVHLSNAGSAALVPVFVAYMTRYQIEPEERALHAKFGAELDRYRSLVRRWI
jgi:protein-S-isoprenylcysteine O-methyltransferase Ste14